MFVVAVVLEICAPVERFVTRHVIAVPFGFENRMSSYRLVVSTGKLAPGFRTVQKVWWLSSQ